MKNALFISSPSSSDQEAINQLVLTLKENAVFETLKCEILEMSEFASSGDNIHSGSITALRKSDYFVLILFHRYGDTRWDNGKSITECEYDEALKLYEKKHIKEMFFYFATEDYKISPGQIPSIKEGQDQLITFKQKIGDIKHGHSIGYFNSTEELIKHVTKDITKKLLEENQAKEKATFRIGQFKERITDKVEEVTSSLIDYNTVLGKELIKFFGENTFFIHNGKKIKAEEIKIAIPDHTKDPPGLKNPIPGVLEFWNIRHVVFRTVTAQVLISAVDKDRLYDEAVKIGQSAAEDIIKKCLEKDELYPDSLHSFLEAINYWDNTGGWATLEDFKESSDNDSEIEIRLSNNFLKHECDAYDVNHLNRFWCGYIFGIVNQGIEYLSHQSKNPALTNETLISEYRYLNEVTYIGEEKAGLIDVFKLTFIKHKYHDIITKIEDIYFALVRLENANEAEKLIVKRNIKNAFCDCIEQILKVKNENDQQFIDIFYTFTGKNKNVSIDDILFSDKYFGDISFINSGSRLKEDELNTIRFFIDQINPVLSNLPEK